MENAQCQYRLFYNALVRFEQEFPRKLKPNSPSEFATVGRIHQIVHPDDEDFSEYRVDRVVQKVCLVTSVTHQVLTGVGPWVKPGEDWWVRAKIRSLGLFSSMVQMSLMALRLESGNEDVGSAGIGGLNFVDIETRRLVEDTLLQGLIQLVAILG